MGHRRAAFIAAEKNFRRIMGHRHLWMLETALDESQMNQQLAEKMKAEEPQQNPSRHRVLSTIDGASSRKMEFFNGLLTRFKRKDFMRSVNAELTGSRSSSTRG